MSQDLISNSSSRQMSSASRSASEDSADSMPSLVSSASLDEVDARLASITTRLNGMRLTSPAVGVVPHNDVRVHTQYQPPPGLALAGPLPTSSNIGFQRICAWCGRQLDHTCRVCPLLNKIALLTSELTPGGRQEHDLCTDLQQTIQTLENGRS